MFASVSGSTADMTLPPCLLADEGKGSSQDGRRISYDCKMLTIVTAIDVKDPESECMITCC